MALPVAAVSLIAAVIVTTPAKLGGGMAVSDVRALEIAQVHCASCHSATPSNEAFSEAPKNIELESIADLRRYEALIMAQAVRSSAMPLGNETGMSKQERELLGAWLQRH